MKRILLSLAHMSGKEEGFIREAFDSNWVVPLGPNVDGFERDLEAWIGKKAGREVHVVALSSGTAAIHLALVMLGVGPGDEVICQSFTFAASANPVCYQGATPVFVDSEPDTWNIDPQLLETAIEDRLQKTGKLPKAIIPVHLYGTPARMNEVMDVANRYGIPAEKVVERCHNVANPGRKVTEYVPPRKESSWDMAGIPSVEMDLSSVKTVEHRYGSEEALDPAVAGLGHEELATGLTGTYQFLLSETRETTPGAAGRTRLGDIFGEREEDVVMADGPAGVRLANTYRWKKGKYPKERSAYSE